MEQARGPGGSTARGRTWGEHDLTVVFTFRERAHLSGRGGQAETSLQLVGDAFDPSDASRTLHAHGRPVFQPIPSVQMANHRSNRRSSPVDRFVRLRWVRRVLAVVLVPLLVLGAFGGTSLLAHAHDGHGSHFHAASSVVGARLAAEQHRLAHASGTASCHDVNNHHGVSSAPDRSPSEPAGDPKHLPDAEAPGGLIISIPDVEQLVSRGTDLSQELQATQVFQCVLAWVWVQPDVSEEPGSPGGAREVQGPVYLASLTAGQRLVRTSKALLI